MATTHVRVPGGGNTYLQAGVGSIGDVEFLANFNDSPGGPVGRATAIHPIGSAYPIEIATPYAQDHGTLTLTVWSTWGTDGWVSAFLYTGIAQSGDGGTSKITSPWNGYVSPHGFVGQPVDLREVFDAQRKLTGNKSFVIKKFERGADGNTVRVKTYENCVIVDIGATEQVSNERMEQQVTITIWYTHVTVSKG